MEDIALNYIYRHGTNHKDLMNLRAVLHAYHNGDLQVIDEGDTLVHRREELGPINQDNRHPSFLFVLFEKVTEWHAQHGSGRYELKMYLCPF